jgi:DNA polymerase-4
MNPNESLGDLGLELASRARGEDDRPVVEGRDPKSMSAERTFSADISDWPELRTVILRLSETVGRRLRKAKLAGWQGIRSGLRSVGRILRP